jgi:hypothetical protein
LLVGASALAFVLALPYFAPMIANLLARKGAHPPLALVLFAQGVQSTLFVAVFALAGAHLAPRVGLDAPAFRALAERRPAWPQLRRQLAPGVLGGVVASIVTTAIQLAFRARLPAPMRLHPGPIAWSGLCSAFYGGVVEELLLRWGVLVLLAFLLAKARVPSGTAFWVANLLAAALFGMGHLPAARAAVGPLGPATIVYVVVANAAAGVVFGVLFRRRGLESAMIAHASADVWLHALSPLWPA